MVEVPSDCKAGSQPAEKRTGSDENKALSGTQTQQMKVGPVEFRQPFHRPLQDRYRDGDNHPGQHPGHCSLKQALVKKRAADEGASGPHQTRHIDFVTPLGDVQANGVTHDQNNAHRE